MIGVAEIHQQDDQAMRSDHAVGLVRMNDLHAADSYSCRCQRVPTADSGAINRLLYSSSGGTPEGLSAAKLELGYFAGIVTNVRGVCVKSKLSSRLLERASV